MPPNPLNSNSLGRPAILSTRNIFKRSFAYKTVQGRLPVILTRVIDKLYRDKKIIAEKYGKESLASCKEVVGRLSLLKNELQTNKLLTPLPASLIPLTHDDSEVWNAALKIYEAKYGVELKWFTAPWLFAECYMYARIHNAFLHSSLLQNFDPFLDQKMTALNDSIDAIESLVAYILPIINNAQQSQKMGILTSLLEVCLWGNKCDLSISGGAENSQNCNVLLSLDILRSKILINDCKDFYQLLISLPEDQRHIDYVLDNVGFELISDLCLLLFLMEGGFASSATIHTKMYPWFVSDTTSADLHFTISNLSQRGGSFKELADKWSAMIQSERWVVKDLPFWNTPYSFAEMLLVDPSTFDNLSKSSVIIFKGDLSYRKLVGDLDWHPEINFKQALQGFFPAPILAVRTIKGGPVVGLQKGQLDSVEAESIEWNCTGDYGMIQLCTSL